MGHVYGDIAASIRAKEDEIRHEDLIRWIKEQLSDLSTTQLELVYDICNNAEDYQSFFEIIKRVSSKRSRF